ncbi:YibE/F family protein [Tessaracoccus sp. SD287]|uniref:YibE/F family protein n=1 Tax=Tessaracoccus sp. SD287 TaxID=2782008 RepID=UPI001A97168D|nr:YibE/F family protein [Tessaracoccus sp. SD287]MBO1030279.1 YibE/F family protein [Tessaracoccus sp. SD287]
MAHSHSHGDDAELTPAQRAHQKQAARVLAILLVPLAVLTFVALVVMWPQDTASHIREDTGIVRVPGTTYQRGTIVEVKEASCDGQVGTFPGDTSICATLTVRVDDGPDQGSLQTFELTSAVYQSGADPGQQVRMYRVPLEGTDAVYSFVDFERSTPVMFFVVLFAVLVVAVARLRGFLALVGLGFAFWILIEFMMPNLIQGKDPVIVGVVGSAAIMFVVLYTSHGFSVRTTTALVGTLFGLLLAAILGSISTTWSHLTGVTHEDDFILAASAPDLQMTSIVICSMIVAALGALNDVTITQASSVWELAKTVKSPWQLYRSAMRIGRDHIASTVYTIAFASAGAALSVLLLIQIYEQSLADMVFEELFAGEILRTIIGSIGLVLAVPLTTGIGVLAVSAGRAAGRRAAGSDESAGAGDDHGEPLEGRGVVAEDGTGGSIGTTSPGRPGGTAADHTAFQRPAD